MRKLWPILSLLAIAGCHYHGEYPTARNPDCEPSYTYREERIEPVAPQPYDTGEQWESQTYNHEPVTVYERPAGTYEPQPPMVYEEQVYQPVIIEGGTVYSNPYYYDNDGSYYHGPYNRGHDNDRDVRIDNRDRDVRHDRVDRDVRRDDSQSGDRVRNRDQQKKLKDAVEAQEDRRRQREQAVERSAKMPVRIEKNKTDDQQQVDRDRKRSSSDDADQTVEAKKTQPKAQPKKSDPAPERSTGKSTRSKRPAAGDSDSSDSTRVRRR